MNSSILEYIQPSATIDSRNARISAFAAESAGDARDSRQKAIRLYYAVRDGIRYDPYSIELTVESLKASHTLSVGRGWCVPKAILLAAGCRSLGIPARLGFADVRNHLSTARMREAMKTDVFFWHGYTAIYLDNVWVKATPAFNIELCERFRIRPLDFDGRSNAIYHPFDLNGNRHMEYLQYRGEFTDVPLDQIIETFQREYVFTPSWNSADFDHEAALETAVNL
ncbi:MAG: transglutaminase family protein [Deltaproteobacteria bacterium]|nr:transglutaminase family protein [Deltaproteobacteria bacterium]